MFPHQVSRSGLCRPGCCDGDFMKTSLILRTALYGLVFGIGAQAATWYVAPNGSDNSSCNSSTSPCASVNGAYQKASGGDIIQMAGGNYGSQNMNPKSPSSDIIVQPASGATVVVDDLIINGATHLEFRNLTTKGFEVHINSNFITLRNVPVNGWLGYDGGSNITMIGGSVGPVVDAHPQIAPANGWQGQGLNFAFDGVLFHDITRSNTSIHTECLQVAGTTNMIIRNSKFTNCDVFDLSFTSYNGAGSVTNLLLENNFFDTAGSGGFFSVHFSAMAGGTVRFNSASQAMFVDTTAPNSGTLSVIGNNIVGGLLDGNSGGCLGSSMAGSYAYNVTQGVKCGSSDLNAAPGFVNATGVDFHLVNGAAAIDFVPTSAGYPATDIDGKPRPIGAKVDAGASEFGTPSGSGAPNPPTQMQATVQ
jgi:hypothetical protein